MKLHQIQGINETYNPNLIMGMEIVFVAVICPLTGTRRPPIRQPDQWDHVRRLTNMLFLAWDDTNPAEGAVYLGKLIKDNELTKKAQQP